MIIRVVRVYVEGFGKLAIAPLSGTFVVAFEWLTEGASWLEASGKAFGFLLSSLAIASKEGLGLAWPCVVACKGRVTLVEILMPAAFAGHATRLTAVRARNTGILTVAAVTLEIAVVRSGRR